MEVKVYRQGNYIIIEDVPSGAVVWSKYAINLVIDPDNETESIFRFYDVLDYRETGQRSEFFDSDISLIQDQKGVLYTISTFIAFYTANTGTVYDTTPVPVTTTYLKDRVVVITSSNNFNSNVPANVPDLTYTITQDGDYVFYAIVNNNNDQNEELEMYFAINGSPILDSVVYQTERKNQDDSIQGTYDINGLVNGDVVTVQLDTRGDNVDLLTRRMLIQSWELV
jgi:hypothetical protein